MHRSDIDQKIQLKIILSLLEFDDENGENSYEKCIRGAVQSKQNTTISQEVQNVINLYMHR